MFGLEVPSSFKEYIAYHELYGRIGATFWVPPCAAVMPAFFT
jgi:hypothetical protein